MREVVTSGIICLDGEYGFTYHIAEIRYTEREDETFCYEIIPNYSVIDDSNRKAYFKLFMSLYRTKRRYLDERRRNEISNLPSKETTKEELELKSTKWNQLIPFSIMNLEELM